ncbi:hypothetical protein I4U23_025017 [Adineta vaga]|nr:hypothetical protein I4U23_025017 [Adineta vaga]
MASISNFLFSLPTTLFSQQQHNSDEIVNSDENNIDPLQSLSLTSMDESNLPITGICLVSKPESVPTGYTCIRKVYDDRSKDADLMPDTFFERKDRFICITHSPHTLISDKAYVLEDIKLIHERDTPPPPYIALTHTYDGQEKATTKRTICIKLVERQTGLKCICDITFLYRTKRPPQSYTIIGEINGLQMCIKEGTVPSYSKTPSNIYPNPHNYSPHYGSTEHSNTNTMTKKSDGKEMLDGIPFQINAKYLSTNRNNKDNFFDSDSFRILSPYEIEQIFYYDFNLERSYLS